MDGQFLLISTVMVWSGSTGLYLERLRPLHAREKCPPRETAITCREVCPRESPIRDVARGCWSDRNFWPLTSCCTVAADGFINPNYEDYCPAQICVSEAVCLPKCPFSLTNYSLGQVGHGPCEYRDTGHGKAKAPGLKLVRFDEKGCSGSVKLTVSIVGLLELSFISRVLTERLSDDQMHPSWTTHTCAQCKR